MTASASHPSSVVTPTPKRASSRSPEGALTLDALLDLAPDDLRVLYETASVPKLSDVHGDLEGRLLASPLVHGAVARGIRAFARSSFFPWRGKSFTAPSSSASSSGARGEGKNRVVTDRNKVFRFETFIGKSRAGDFDSLQLDYDLPENPLFIRIIKDEIRTLRPGLWLGQAYVVARGKTTLALYFGLADRNQARG